MLRRFYVPFKDVVAGLAAADTAHVKAEGTPSPYACPLCGRRCEYRLGKTGKFLSCSGYREQIPVELPPAKVPAKPAKKSKASTKPAKPVKPPWVTTGVRSLWQCLSTSATSWVLRGYTTPSGTVRGRPLQSCWCLMLASAPVTNP